MKTLVDTCVWSLSLRRRSKSALNEAEQRYVRSLAEAIQDGRVAMIGPIRQEILSGIKDAGQFEKLRSALDAFDDEPIATQDYEQAARLYNLCRSRGIECGPVDILICAVAAANRWSLLTSDTGLMRCVEALKVDGQFHPAP
jgi:predicted nucleic acid-binding protein